MTVSIGKLELTILMPTYLDSFPRVRNLVYYLRNMQIGSCVQNAGEETLRLSSTSKVYTSTFSTYTRDMVRVSIFSGDIGLGGLSIGCKYSLSEGNRQICSCVLYAD